MGKLIGYVEGADIYLVVALLLFLFVFIVAGIYLLTMTKDEVSNLSNMPLSNSKKESHEN